MSMKPEIVQYIAEVNAQYITGYAREHSYRPALQALLTAFLPKYKATNEPARIECGAPDFIITKGGDTPMAFVECKDIGDPDLDGQRQHKEQFNRYKSSLGNIVFTDYLDFHLYVDGEFVDSVRIAEVKGGKMVAIETNEPLFLQLIDRLANAQPQKITSSAKLAVIMANKARLLADVIEQSVNARHCPIHHCRRQPCGEIDLQRRLRVLQRHTMLQQRARGGVEFLHWRLPARPEMVERPERTQPHL